MIDSLEDKIRQAGSPVTLLRHSRARTDVGAMGGADYSNWRDEQTGWRDSCAMFDLSHHMHDITLRGPDALRLVSYLGVNSWENFKPGRAKQFVAVNAEGFFIGDAIAEYLDDGAIRLAGTAAAPNWIEFHIATGDFDVEFSRDAPTAMNPAGHPEIYRYQLQGPRALDVLRKACGGDIPQIKFFRATKLVIDGTQVIALGHGMARSQGLELIGPWADSARIRTALIEAGQEFGLTPNGSRSPGSAALESGWVPAPLPAIYSGDALKEYRSWLPGNGFEATGGLGGSFTSDDISDFYLTPHDLDYARLVAFDHDFIGREALEAVINQPTRRKVTLEWNTQDVLGVMASQFEKETPGKGFEFPIISFSTWSYDKVLSGDTMTGLSTFAGYTYNERKILSLATLDTAVEVGDEVVVVWGEEDGGAGKAHVETHVQTPIRAKVCRVPYSDVYYK